MERVWLSRGARGPVVLKLQRALNGVGAGLKADGDFGAKTEAAVVALGFPGVTSACWRQLFSAEQPELFLRCLSLTSQFENHGFTEPRGNWDNAGITWGIIGFTLASGSLCTVLRRVPREVLDSVFGVPAAAELLAVCASSVAQRLTWANEHSDHDTVLYGKTKVLLAEPWHTAFQRLGGLTEVQAIQLDVARELYWTPSQKARQARTPFLISERAAAMFFDCHVQQGRVYDSAVSAARQHSPEGEATALAALAHAQAQGKWADDIRARRMTIASGEGTVHKVRFNLFHYGITLDRDRVLR